MTQSQDEEPRTVAGAFAKIRSHEELCAWRYKGIDNKLNGVIGAIVAMGVGLLAWMAVQLYSLEPLRAQASMAAAMATVAAAQSSTSSAQAATSAAQTATTAAQQNRHPH